MACIYTLPLFMIATMAEMIYLMISIITGNWNTALLSIGSYVMLMTLIYLAGIVMEGMKLC